MRVCVWVHYLISCEYSCVWSMSCGLLVWKPYTQWDKLAAFHTIINWNNIYRSAFRPVANGFWAKAGKSLCVCVYVSLPLADTVKCMTAVEWELSRSTASLLLMTVALYASMETAVFLSCSSACRIIVRWLRFGLNSYIHVSEYDWTDMRCLLQNRHEYWASKKQCCHL